MPDQPEAVKDSFVLDLESRSSAILRTLLQNPLIPHDANTNLLALPLGIFRPSLVRLLTGDGRVRIRRSRQFPSLVLGTSKR
jgi:hypothetical protein